MSGRFRDPHVGRDLLYGVLLGMAWSILFGIGFVLAQRSGLQPSFSDRGVLFGLRGTLGTVIYHLTNSVIGTLQFFFVMFVLRVIARKPWLAAICFVAVFAGMRIIGSSNPWTIGALYVAIYGIAAFVVLRFGFVSLAAGIFVADLLLNIPTVTTMSSWFVGNLMFVLAVVLALAAWGCYTSLGGQKIFGERLLE